MFHANTIRFKAEVLNKRGKNRVVFKGNPFQTLTHNIPKKLKAEFFGLQLRSFLHLSKYVLRNLGQLSGECRKTTISKQAPTQRLFRQMGYS